MEGCLDQAGFIKRGGVIMVVLIVGNGWRWGIEDVSFIIAVFIVLLRMQFLYGL